VKSTKTARPWFNSASTAVGDQLCQTDSAARPDASGAFKRGQTSPALATHASSATGPSQRRRDCGKCQAHIKALTANKTSSMAMAASKLVCWPKTHNSHTTVTHKGKAISVLNTPIQAPGRGKN
jgi:hypothetical protein